MLKLLSSHELAPVFMAAGYYGGGELEAGFRLIQAGPACAFLSILRIYWQRKAPKSWLSWAVWIGIYAMISLATAFFGNGKFGLLPFCAGFLGLLIPLVKCVEDTCSTYNSMMQWCHNVVKASSSNITREQMKFLVRSYGPKNLVEFKAVQEKFLIGEDKGALV